MSAHTVGPWRQLVPSFVPHFPCYLRPSLPLFHRQRHHLFTCRSSARGWSSDRQKDDHPSNDFDSSGGEKHCSALWSEITSLEPMLSEPLEEHASADARSAMRAVVFGMLGCLPSAQFQVSIRVLRDQLASVLLSALCTGYALRNAEYALQLQQAFGMDREGPPELSSEDRANLPMRVAAYVESLEARLQEEQLGPNLLSSQGGQPTSTHMSDLLSYVKGMDIKELTQLSQETGSCVLEAFQTVVSKVLVRLKISQPMPSAPSLGRQSDFDPAFLNVGGIFLLSRERLMEVLLWCMLVGHYTKSVEYRLSLEQCMPEGKTEMEEQKQASGKAWFERLGAFLLNGLSGL